MNRELTPASSYVAQQQLQGILVELADIERRLRSVNRAVAGIVSELAPVEEPEAALSVADEGAQMRAALVKPRSPVVVQTLVEANHRAAHLRQLSPPEFEALMAQSMQQALSDAQLKGIVIDDEAEAALGD